MGYSTPLSTPDGSPRVLVVDSSTPWAENGLHDDLSTINAINNPPRPRSRFGYASTVNNRCRIRIYNKLLLLTIGMMVLLWWYGGGGSKQSIQYGKGIPTRQQELAGMKFISANHPFIRYVGRWTTVPDASRRDGSFPGTYFDIAFNGSSTVLLSLHNSQQASSQSPMTDVADKLPTLEFFQSANNSTAQPISLLARVDDDEYIILPNATSLVSVRKGNLNADHRHEIRIIAPMVGGTVEALQFEGIWLDEGGQLLTFEDSDTRPGFTEDHSSQPQTKAPSQRKMLEIVTDFPGYMSEKYRRKNIGTTRNILGGVMGWEYLLGEMFGADHITIGMDGMCLIRECIGGRGSPSGLADVFFQSGPLGSEQYAQPWLFEEYVPDVMVMNIGNSDWESFQRRKGDYNNKTTWDLSVMFEDTYVSLIQAIRTLAYPKYSTMDHDSFRINNSPRTAQLPIFVMRPLRGQLEQATHSVVDRLRLDGDKLVFWLDTSGWLDTIIDFEGRAEDQDFFLDEESSSREWRLTERGNQRVAILLHMHVCRYLARDAEKCVFLRPEVYQGKASDPAL